jgi:subtilase family serine protease
VLCASGALAVGGLAPAAPASAATPAAAGPVSADSAKVLSGSSPSWAEPATDQGAAPAGATRTARVLLAGRDAAGLADYAEQVSSPGSAVYAKYLTTAQVERQYGSSAQQLAAVKKWLAGAGLTVTGSSTGGFTDYLTVSGPAKAVDAAFHTSLHRYRVGSAVRTAPSSDARVPAAVSGAVLGVTGLSDLQPTAHAGATRSTAGTTGTASPAQSAAGESGGSGSFPTSATCSAYWGEKKVGGTGPATYNKDTPYDQCSLVPKQLRKAYGVSAGGLTGKGARVAVVDAYGSSTMESDADTYAAGHGDQPFRSGQYTEVKDPSKWTNQAACGGPAGWAPEEALDVEMVHGLAPDANVVYVGADSCLDSDLYDALDTIVSKHLADVVSNSWGEIMHTTDGQDVAASEIASYTQLFQRGAVEGIGFDFSAGDCGDSSPLAAASGANCQTDTARAQANWPDSSPWVTAVGGTALGLKDSSGGYGFETDMGTHRSALSADGGSWTPFPAPFYFGGGGGTSEDFAQPWYQAGHVPASLSHTLMTGQKSSTARRVTPDVALNGDLYTSVLVGISDGAPYSEAGYGGTSVSAPEFSAVQADAIQARHGLPVGFADPELYARQHAGVFRDVVNDRARAGRPPLDSVYDAGVVNGRPVVRLVTFGQDTSLVATSGYDDATGLGSPTAAYLDSFR